MAITSKDYRQTVNNLIAQMQNNNVNNKNLRHGIFLEIAGKSYKLGKIEYNTELKQIYFIATRKSIEISAEQSLRVVKEERKKSEENILDIFLIVKKGENSYLKAPLAEIQRGGLYFNLISDDNYLETINIL